MQVAFRKENNTTFFGTPDHISISTSPQAQKIYACYFLEKDCGANIAHIWSNRQGKEPLQFLILPLQSNMTGRF